MSNSGCVPGHTGLHVLYVNLPLSFTQDISNLHVYLEPKGLTFSGLHCISYTHFYQCKLQKCRTSIPMTLNIIFYLATITPICTMCINFNGGIHVVKHIYMYLLYM